MDRFKHAREQIAKARANRPTGEEAVRLLRAACQEAHETAGMLMAGVDVREIYKRRR